MPIRVAAGRLTQTSAKKLACRIGSTAVQTGRTTQDRGRCAVQRGDCVFKSEALNEEAVGSLPVGQPRLPNWRLFDCKESDRYLHNQTDIIT